MDAAQSNISNLLLSMPLSLARLETERLEPV
jgi:hypothetical protein